VIISGPRQVSHGELLDRAARVASGFQALGCREGSSIALCLRNDFAFFEASFGAALLGAYPVPVNWHFTVDEACYLITDCNAAVIVVHADLFVRLRNAFPPEAHVLVVESPPEIREAYGPRPRAALFVRARNISKPHGSAYANACRPSFLTGRSSVQS
jgi:long-chain acyl-CoA synthetase